MERERKEHEMSRFKEQQPHKERLALCHRISADFVALPWVPTRTPTEHWCLTKQAVGGLQRGPQRRPPTNDNKEALRQTCFQQKGVILHLESCMVAEMTLEIRNIRNDVVEYGMMLSNSLNAQRTETHHPREDHSGSLERDEAHQGSAESVH